MALTVV